MERKVRKRCGGIGRAFLFRKEGSAAPLLAFAMAALVGAAGLAPTSEGVLRGPA